MEDKDIKSILEALLFVSGNPIDLETLKNILGIESGQIEKAMMELVSEYSLKNSGILIIGVAGGFQMVTNPAFSQWVKKLIAIAIPARLSNQSLETLSIIAYKQPITKAEIEAIRGVNSDGVIKTLIDRRLIKVFGRKEAPGRPLMYGTTKEFLRCFGLKDLSELPTVKEIQEIGETESSP